MRPERTLLLAISLLATGCVPILHVTPGAGGSGFRLPADEWCSPNEQLVIACYRLKVGSLVDKPQRYRVLRPNARGSYVTPNETLVGGAILLPWYARVSTQLRPLYYICGANGRHGFLDPDPARDSDFFHSRCVPRIENIDGVLRVAQYPPPQSVWLPTVEMVEGRRRVSVATTMRSALEPDTIVGRMLVAMLVWHDPERKRVTIPRADAQALAAYIAWHGDRFSEPTRLMARRLSEEYGRGARLSAWGRLDYAYEQGVTPRLETIWRDLSPDDQKFLLRCGYVPPVGPAPSPQSAVSSQAIPGRPAEP